MGYEGFSGNESILYHLQSPCDVAEVGAFEPIVLEEWVPGAQVHRLTQTAGLAPAGDPISGRRVLMFNDDVEMAICRPAVEQEGFYRNGEGDEVDLRPRGLGRRRDDLRVAAIRPARLRRHPTRHDLSRPDATTRRRRG